MAGAVARGCPRPRLRRIPAGAGAPAEEKVGVDEEENVAIRRDMGLEVEIEDVEDLIVKHTDELTTEGLVALQQEEWSMEVTEEEGEGVLSVNDIKDFLKQWEAVCTVILVHHPNKRIAGRSVNILEENVIEHFRDVLKLGQKQVSIE